MANKDTRILKSNTLEELRQKSNEISLHLGDNDQLNSNVNDKTFNYNNVSAGSSLFQGADDAGKSIDFEIKPEESLDNTAGYIILKGSPTVPASFAVNANITQSGGYSATIVSASAEKILVKNSSGTFNASQNLVVGSDNIPNGNVVRIVAESYPVGVVRVYKNGTELGQNLLADGFHVVNLLGSIPLSNNPTVTDFVEGSTIYQGSNLGSASFSATVLRATSTLLLVKSVSGTLNAGTLIKLDGSSSTITGANHGALTSVDSSFGNAIELNTPAAANDDIKIHGPTIVDAVNELQDDVGVTENLATGASNIVDAINEIESVFDASTREITAGSNAFNVTSGTFTIDSAGDVILDSNSGNITLRAGGTQFGEIDKVSGTNNILIKSGTSPMLTGNGADATFAQDVTVTRDVDIDRNLNVDGATTLDGTTIDGNLDLNGQLDVSSHATINGNTTLVGNLNTRGNNFLGNGTGDDTTISGDLTVAVDGVVQGNFTVNGATLDINANSFVSGNSQVDLNFNVDGSTTLNGTTIDGDLDLNGSVDVSTNATIHGNLDVDGTSNLDVVDIDGAVDMATTLHVHGNTQIDGVLDIGTLNSKFTNTNNVKLALNELHDELGNAVITGSGTPAAGQTNITNAVNSIDAEIGATTYIAGSGTNATITYALDAIQDYIGTYTSGTPQANTVASTITGALNQLHTEVGTLSLDTGHNNLTAAVNQLHTEINSNDTDIGNLMKLIDGNTTVDSSISFTDISATNIKAAIEELETEKVYLTSSTRQTLDSQFNLDRNITFRTHSSGQNTGTFVFNTGTTLDLSNASLLLPGNASNVNIFSTSFLEVDGNVETPMGFSVDRQHVTLTDKNDVKIQWHENYADGTTASRPARAWQLVGLNDAAATNTADIVTFYNAKELITNNTETGINVVWDASNQNFDFTLDNSVFTLTGDVTGSVTQTAKGNVSIATTIQPNSVALGTDTTGNYVKTIAGTQYQVTVTPSGHSEGKDAVLSIPNDFRMPGTAKVLSTTDSTTATTGALQVSGGVGIAKNLVVGGNLTVQGTQTILNTETLTVEDTLVLAGNNLSSEPSSGGFGLEVGPITNPSGVASGVTGAHSIVYNYATDQWEADGSLILSNATNTPPTIESNNFGAGKNLDFNAGTGISITTTTSGNDIDVQITNTLDGYSGWFLSTQGTNRGNIADDERVDFHGGTALTATYDTVNNNRVIFNHNDFITAGTYGQAGTEDGTYVKSLTVNAQGHVTAVTTDDFDDRYDNYGSWQMYLNGTSTDAITSGERFGFDEGPGIDLAYDNSDLTISHQDTSSVANLTSNNSGNTFIQDIDFDFDTFGHVTGATVGTGTVTVGDATITLAAADVDGVAGITMDSDNSFTTNQSTNETITIAHANTSSQGSVNNSGNNVIQDITLDTYGHLTGLVSKNITTVDNASALYLTAQNGGDSSWSNNYPLAWFNAGGTAYRSAYEDDNLTYNPHTNTLNAGTFNGNIAWGNVTGKPTLDNYANWRLYVNSSLAKTVTSTGVVGFNAYDAGISIAFVSSQNVQIRNTMHSNNTLIKDDSRNTRGVTRLYRRDDNSDFSVQTYWTGTRWRLYGYNGDTAHADTHVGYADSAGNVNNATITLDPVGQIRMNGSTNNADFTTNQSAAETITIGVNSTSASTVSTVVERDSSGDINARLFRSEYDSQASASNINHIMVQHNTVSDNYIRPASPATIRDVLNVADGANNYSFGIDTVTSGGPAGATVTNGQTVTFDDGTGMSVTNNGRLFTFTNTAPDTGRPAILSDGNTPSLNTNITAAEIRSLIGAGTATVNDTGTPAILSDGTLNRTAASIRSDIGAGTSNQNLGSGSSLQLLSLGVGIANSTSGTIKASGDIVAYASSDERLKDNLTPIDNALEKVNKLSGYEFDWNDKQDLYEGHDIGVIAQEVEEVAPEIVDTREDGYKAVKYEKLTALLINAVNELTEQNKELRSEIEALKDINS